MKRFYFRHMPATKFMSALLACIGATLVMASILYLQDLLHAPLMIASLGATAVLLFATPHSPVSQPINVVGGHVISALVGLALVAVFPGHHLMAGLAVGLSIAVMMQLRIVNPPAGATALLAYLTNPGWWFAVFPVFSGCVVMIALATVIHRIRGVEYPLRLT